MVDNTRYKERGYNTINLWYCATSFYKIMLHRYIDIFLPDLNAIKQKK